jgi:hypothetical protein
MSARVLVVGLDAGDPTTARTLAADGRMPVLARLLAESAQYPMTRAYGGAYVAERWTSIATGVGPEIHWLLHVTPAGRDRTEVEEASDAQRRRVAGSVLGAVGVPRGALCPQTFPAARRQQSRLSRA